jgi:ABC-type sugar transport system ATPase subunit
MLHSLSVKAASPEIHIEHLSGGNQQKVVLARWLHTEPHGVLLDEPTRGVDIGAKSDIYEVVASLAASGVAVVVASSEVTELMGLCDRILVMHEGRIGAELQGGAATEESIVRAATGLSHLLDDDGAAADPATAEHL